MVSKDLTNMAKMEFVQRKVEFMQEFGDVGRYRDAWDQLKKFRHLCSADLKLEARRRAELEEEEKRLQGLEEMRAQAKAEANMKAKIAESEGRLMCSKCQSEIKRSLEQKTKYKEVAPTRELNFERYGYGAKRKAYDPDYEHVESSKYREYERLEGEGYDDIGWDDVITGGVFLISRGELARLVAKTRSSQILLPVVIRISDTNHCSGNY